MILNEKAMLLDGWEVNGTKKKDLYEVLEKLTEMTTTIPLSTKAIQIMTVRECSDSVYGYLHNSAGTQNVAVSMGDMETEFGATDALLHETAESSYLMFRLGKHMFFVTKKVLKTLCQRAGSSMGDFAIRDEMNIRFHRDAGYVNYMNTVPSQAQVLIRQSGNTKKVFAVFADRYKEIPQHPLVKKLIESFDTEMGESELIGFTVNNFDTEIYLEFPKKADDFKKTYDLPHDVVPGIRIHISDTGESSFIINGSIRVKNSIIYVPGAEYVRAHTKNADLQKIFEAVKERVFVEYTKVPERLIELLQIEIKNPVECTQRVSKFCDLKKQVGAGTEEEILNSLEMAINPNLKYTGYDIATMFLEAGTGLEGKYKTNEMNSKIRNSFVKAVFYQYEKE